MVAFENVRVQQIPVNIWKQSFTCLLNSNAGIIMFKAMLDMLRPGQRFFRLNPVFQMSLQAFPLFPNKGYLPVDYLPPEPPSYLASSET